MRARKVRAASVRVHCTCGPDERATPISRSRSSRSSGTRSSADVSAHDRRGKASLRATPSEQPAARSRRSLIARWITASHLGDYSRHMEKSIFGSRGRGLLVAANGLLVAGDQICGTSYLWLCGATVLPLGGPIVGGEMG